MQIQKKQVNGFWNELIVKVDESLLGGLLTKQLISHFSQFIVAGFNPSLPFLNLHHHWLYLIRAENRGFEKMFIAYSLFSFAG